MHTTAFPIPADKLQLIVGTKGQNVNDLRHRYGTEVITPEKDNRYSTVICEGRVGHNMEECVDSLMNCFGTFTTAQFKSLGTYPLTADLAVKLRNYRTNRLADHYHTMYGLMDYYTVIIHMDHSAQILNIYTIDQWTLDSIEDELRLIVCDFLLRLGFFV